MLALTFKRGNSLQPLSLQRIINIEGLSGLEKYSYENDP